MTKRKRYSPEFKAKAARAAITDWHTRHMLAWRLSTTQDTEMCREAPVGGFLPAVHAARLPVVAVL